MPVYREVSFLGRPVGFCSGSLEVQPWFCVFCNDCNNVAHLVSMRHKAHSKGACDHRRVLVTKQTMYPANWNRDPEWVHTFIHHTTLSQSPSHGPTCSHEPSFAGSFLVQGRQIPLGIMHRLGRSQTYTLHVLRCWRCLLVPEEQSTAVVFLKQHKSFCGPASSPPVEHLVISDRGGGLNPEVWDGGGGAGGGERLFVEYCRSKVHGFRERLRGRCVLL